MNNVKVYGYKEWFLVKPKVKVYIEKDFIGEILYNDNFDFEVDKDCILTFKCNMRTTDIKVYRDKTNEIQLEFDRVTGQLKAKYRS